MSAAEAGRVRGGPGGSALRLPGGPAGRRVPGVPAGPADAARPALGGRRVRSAWGRRVPGVPQTGLGAPGSGLGRNLSYSLAGGHAFPWGQGSIQNH